MRHRQASGSGTAEIVRALWYSAAGQAELRQERLSPPGPDGVRARTLWTALSRGTERLVFEGRVPASVAGRMRAPAQSGEFPFPVKYGYCAVAETEDGERVFALQPHQEAFVAPRAALCPLPEGLPPRRAVLAANMETALNALWDSGAGPGDRIAVVGGGVVGLLVAHLCAGLPGADVCLIDRDPARAGTARALGLAFALPEAVAPEADIVFHASASEAGLALALSLAGEEAGIVELSWYGETAVAAPLGLAFHAKRLRLVASQVGAVAASRRPRWSHRRRLLKALDLLRDDRLDALLTEEVAFDDLPAALPRLLGPGAPGLCTVIRY
ncbi:zinc-dependent alcohol dehydrogenase [Methylobacterium currus]|uniref:zinc-dependent alcohol dehydrogenase n=1 Tax=Methylobacterium currus TaxID=2051553 RepID=UPI001FD0194A|nr:zinc-binding alcohol dehydrogenase [Methylobacterium currus]